MGKIIILPQEVSEKIAAGEVIEGPHSVVRELLDNAIDAGATQISVVVNNGGKDFIQVSDNGPGMNEEDALLSIRKHTTSKISSLEDLHRIGSIGFRGEALSSICSVSDFTMLTKTEDSFHGIEVSSKYGKDVKIRPHAANNGTQVTVRNLFYTLPARKKFLGSNRAETAKIKDEILKKALNFYRIGFLFKADDRVVYTLQPRDDLLDRIGDIFGTNIKNNLIPVKEEEDFFSLKVWVSGQNCTLSNRSGQFFFVNSRPVYERSLYVALNNASKASVPAGRYVYAFSFIEIDPTLIDINVHPAKKEIRIKILKKIFNSLSDAVTEAIKKQVHKIHFPENIEVMGEYDRSGVLVKEPFSPEKEGRIFEFYSSAANLQGFFPFTPEGLIFKGVLFSTYIVFEADDYILLVDQHAAHERVLYERFKKQADKSVLKKNLLIPITFTPPGVCVEAISDNLEIFREAGISIEPFGEESYNVVELPAFIPEAKEEETLSILLDDFYEGRLKVSAGDIRDRFMKIAACRNAVKEGDKLTRDEAQRLLQDLAKTEVPHLCPHGRPTFIRQSKGYFEKIFRRR